MKLQKCQWTLSARSIKFNYKKEKAQVFFLNKVLYQDCDLEHVCIYNIGKIIFVIIWNKHIYIYFIARYTPNPFIRYLTFSGIKLISKSLFDKIYLICGIN